MGLAKFDPRAGGPLLLTLVAIVAFWLYSMPGIGGAFAYPELRAEAPAKDLLQDSLLVKASVAPGGPPGMDCQLCSAEGTHRAWRELETFLELYDESNRPDFVREALGGLEQGRAISLSSWGHEPSRELVPDVRAAVQKLAPAGSPYDPLAGVRWIEPARLHRVDWAAFVLQVAVMLLALPLFWRWRWLALPPRPRAFGAAQGAYLFLWCLGAMALLSRLSEEVGLREALWRWYPLPDALLVGCIALLVFPAGSLPALLRHFGLRGGQLRPLAGFTLITLGASLACSWALGWGTAALGYLEPWALASPGVLVRGSDGEGLLRWLSLVVTGPAYEELMFTGLLFGGLVQRFSFRASAVTTALVFSFQHGYDWVGSLDLICGSLLSCWAYWRTGSLWPSVVVHGALNALFAVPIFY